MCTNSRSRKPFITAFIVSVLVLLLVAGTQYALANRTIHPGIKEVIPNSPPDSGDDGVAEVGVEWIKGETRSNFNSASCNGFYNAFVNSGWYGRFNLFQDLARETDLERGAIGGQEDFYPDSVDIAMICSTSELIWDEYWDESLSSVYFNPSSWFSPGEAAKSYGDKDLEWIAFDVPFLLGGLHAWWASIDYRYFWMSTGNGLHLVLGIRSYNYSNYGRNGALWAEYMQGYQGCFLPSSVTQAWFQAVDDLQPSDICATVLAEEQNNFDDHIFGKGYVSPDPSVDMNFSALDHCSTGPASKEFLSNYDQPEVLAMPVVRVIERDVNEDYVRNFIAPAFGLQDEKPCFHNLKYSISSLSGGITQTLMVDQVTGAFSYHNLSKLWTTSEITPSLPSADYSDVLINNWFHGAAKNLPGALYRNAGYEYMTEDIETRVLQPGANGSLQGQEVSRLPVDVSMTYPRVITVAARTTSNTQQVDFPIVGPGGRMKIYLGDQGEIIGAQGGSRDVQVMGDIVTILDPDLVWSMFLDNPSLAIGEAGLVADTITHTAPTLGYYEMPYIVPQDDLIPVWEFRAWFYSDGNLVAEDVPIYIPAANEYMPPQVAILNPDDGSIFLAGDPISFEGSITGGTPPYIVDWSASKDGHLGDSINLIASLTTPIRQNTIYTQQVSFGVIDANGMTGTATISLMIKPRFWLPIIKK